MEWLIVDIATAPIEGVETYLDGAISAPSNYKDPEKIAAYIAEKTAERAVGAALDLDLARITAIGVQIGSVPNVALCQTEDAECGALLGLAEALKAGKYRANQIITYGGFGFDLPMLMRRARYLGVSFPTINLDKYRSPHLDLCELLSDRDYKRRRSLQFYAKRLGWTDIGKTLQGAEESQVFTSGRWDDLRASVEHDLTATYRLAKWLGAIQTAEVVVNDTEMVF